MPNATISLGLAAAAFLAAAPAEAAAPTKEGDVVHLAGTRWAQLHEGSKASEEPLPGPWAEHREVELTRLEDGVRVEVTWKIRTMGEGWFEGVVLGRIGGARIESIRWRGKPATVAATPKGEIVVSRLEKGRSGVLKMVAFVPKGSRGDSLELDLLPAVRGRVRVRARDRRAVLERRDSGEAIPRIRGRHWTGARDLKLTFAEPRTAGEPTKGADGFLALGRSALGLTFGDAELRGRAKVEWIVRRGSTDRVELDVVGVGGDVDLTGANVRGWHRVGDRIEVELQEPETHRVALELSWTQAISAGESSTLVAPVITPREAWRTENYLQVARDGELEVLPRLVGWSGIAASRMPSWAGGLIEGSATSSFHGKASNGDSSFELLRFVPLAGPPVVIDVAAYEVATSDEGRVLLRAQYEVRNERASHLRLSPPAGMRIIGVRVGGEVAVPARGEGGTWLIPLTRSVESVDGLLSFPVEAVLMAEGEGWARREDRSLELPRVDAPIATSRTRLFLPPGFRSRMERGEGDTVDHFSEGEGITYGLGVGDVGIVQAEMKYRDAVSRYLKNDFEGAQQQLEELEDMGASNRNIEGLRANLQVIQKDGNDRGGPAEDPTEPDTEADEGRSTLLERRIKQQAQARAVEDKRAQVRFAEEAKRLEAEGRYDDAERKFEQALELGDRLELLEQEESVEQQQLNEELSVQYEKVEERKARRKRREKSKKSVSSRSATKTPADGKLGGKQKACKTDEHGECVYVVRAGRGPAEGAVAGGGASAGLDVASAAVDQDAEQPTSYEATVSAPLLEDSEDTGVAHFKMVENLERRASELEALEGKQVAKERVRLLELEREAAELDGRPAGSAAALPTSTDEAHGNARGDEWVVLGGEVAAPEPEPPPFEAPTAVADEPAPASYGSGVSGRRRARGGRSRRRVLKGTGSAAPPAAAAKPAPEAPRTVVPGGGDVLDPAPDAPAPTPAALPAALPDPVVRASALSVVIPAIGDPVLYQRLLLPAGEAQRLEIRARAPSRLTNRKYRR
jgi:hypothetical protein